MSMTKTQLMRIALTGAIVAAALPAFAQTTASTAGSTDAKMKTQKKIDVACITAAIDKRDTAIAGAFDTLKNAVMTRKDALKLAWSQTDKKTRRDGIKAAWKAYGASVSSARSARKSAWTTFYATRNACGAGAAAEDATTQAADQSL